MISSQLKNAEKNSEGLNSRVPEGKSKTPPQSLTHTHTHTRVCVCVCMDRYIPFQLLLLMTSMAGLFATIKIKNLELLTPLINLIFPISSS